MRLNILQKAPVKESRYLLREGWECFSGFGGEYIDIETDDFTITDPMSFINTYIQRVVTFHAPKMDGDYTEAWMIIKRNNPDGDHDETESIKLDINVAVALCLKEIK